MPLGVGGTNKELTIANSQSPPDKKGFFFAEEVPSRDPEEKEQDLAVYTHVPVRRHPRSRPDGSQSYCSDEVSVG